MVRFQVDLSRVTSRYCWAHINLVKKISPKKNIYIGHCKLFPVHAAIADDSSQWNVVPQLCLLSFTPLVRFIYIYTYIYIAVFHSPQQSNVSPPWLFSIASWSFAGGVRRSRSWTRKNDWTRSPTKRLAALGDQDGSCFNMFLAANRLWFSYGFHYGFTVFYSW